MSGSPRRSATALRTIAAASLAVVACSTPTDACGCSPAQSVVIATGTVLDAEDAPVAGARIALDGVPPTMSADPPISFEHAATTDAAGGFTVRVYSVFGPDDLSIRAAVVRAGTTDTVRLRIGVVARFRLADEPPDTVRLVLRLPE